MTEQTELNDADRLFYDILDTPLKAQSAKTTDMAEIHDLIGLSYSQEDNYPEARKHYTVSLKLWQQADQPENQAMVLDRIAFTYRSEEDYEQALVHYEQALTLFEQSNDIFHVASTLRNISLIHLFLGNTEQAEATLEQALASIEQAETEAFKAFLYASIGVLYEHQEAYQKALESYERALDIYEKMADQGGKATMLESMGRIYEQQGEPEQALDLYMQSLTIQEEVRTNAGLEELKTSFAESSSFVDAYQGAIFLLVQLKRPDEAFNMSERAHARTFLDQIGNQRIDFRADADDTLINQEQDLRADLANLQKQLQDASNAQERASIEGQIATKQREHQELIKNLKLQHSEYASLASVSPLELSGFQELLDKDTTVLSYYTAPEQSLAFVITQERFTMVELDVGSEDLHEQINTLRQTPRNQPTLPEGASTLYDMLITPLEEHLTTSHLVIIPHGLLHYLPFAALSTDGIRSLIDDYTLTYLPNASSLTYIQQKTADKRDAVLLMGNPDGSLQATEQEVQAIATLYNVEPFIHREATEARLHEQASSAGVVHLAAHGSFNLTNPLYSTIALAPDDAGLYDGLLEVHEVYSLDLQQTDMVVLSACETNVPKMGNEDEENVVSGGDEIVGLTRAFIYAGSPTVISTLWQVPDESSALLMERFYTHYRADMGKAAALRQAQLEVREQYPNFFHWAGFILSGDGGEVSEDEQSKGIAGEEESAEATSGEDEAVATTPAADSSAEDTLATTPASSNNGGGSCLGVGFMLAMGVVAMVVGRQLIYAKRLGK